jgi:hypothetical protein
MCVLASGLALAPGFCLGEKSAGPASPIEFQQGIAGQTVTQSIVLSQDIYATGQTAIVLGADNIVLDCAGHTLSGDGTGNGIESIDRKGVTITNCLIENFEKGIYLASTDGRAEKLLSVGNVVRGNTLEANQHGVFLMWSHQATISGNRLVGNFDSAISLTGNTHEGMRCSNDVTVSENRIRFNRRGLVVFCSYRPASGIRVKDNHFSYNDVSVTDRFQEFDRIAYSSNTFEENLATVFFRYLGDHRLSAGVPKEFDIGLYRSNGEACTDFEVESVAITPGEPVSFTRTGNRVHGRFVPTRNGMYSLVASIRGCDQKLARQRFWLGTEKTMPYYLHPGHRNDVGALFDEPPADTVRVYCTMWIEAGFELSPPGSGIAKITRFRSSMWSNYFPFPERSSYENLWGIEFDHTYSKRGDVFVSIEGEHEKGRIRVAEEINKGPFIYDQADWLDLAIKYWGREPDWTSGPDAPSAVEVSYVVSDAPILESISNRQARVLSATSSPENPEQAEIVLDGRGPTSLSVRMDGALAEYRIDVDGDACGSGSGCRHAQDGALLSIDIELAGVPRTIVIAAE